MDERILLSTYLIKISDDKKNKQILSQFNGSEDFFHLFNEFTKHIYTHVNELKDLSGKKTISLSMEDLATIDEENRCIYGNFSSGIGGDKYKIKDSITNETEMEVLPHHRAVRNVFFYLYLPKFKSVGYLILQRKSTFGIKTKLHPAINSFMRERGFLKYYVEVNNIVHHSVYKQMMKGNLKKVDLIKRKIPNSLESYIDNNQEPQEIKGVFRTSFSSTTSLPDAYKNIIDKLFTKNKHEKATYEIEKLDENYDDIEFELELNGKLKKFYIKNRSRIQPDIDVTKNIIMIDDEPTLDSLKEQSKELISDLLELNP